MNPTDAWIAPAALRRERGALVLIAASSALAFVVVALVVSASRGGTAFDVAVGSWLFERTQSSGLLTAFCRALDIIGGNVASVVLVAVASSALYVRRHRLLAGYYFASALGGVVLCSLVKLMIDRPRPPTVGVLLPESTYSFPSGHATSGVTTFVALGVVCLVALPRRTRWWCAVPLLVLGPVIGVSRIALGVHWPTDVLGGWLLGTAWTSFVALGIVLMVLTATGPPEPARPLDLARG